MKTDKTTYFYHTDQLGSSTVMSDVNGYKKKTIEYYPYGKTKSESATSIQVRHKFTGQEL